MRLSLKKFLDFNEGLKVRLPRGVQLPKVQHKMIFKLEPRGENNNSGSIIKNETSEDLNMGERVPEVPLHFEASTSKSEGQSKLKNVLSIEEEDLRFLKEALDLDGDSFVTRKELKGVKVSLVSDDQLIDNHSRDADVKKMMPSENVFFQYDPKKLPGRNWPRSGELKFNEDIVKVGTDDDGNVISFVCPQKKQIVKNKFARGTLESEVEVGEVGGKIDLKTGEGVIYGDQLAWKFWGDVVVGGIPLSISKDEAAFIPIRSDNGSGGLLALHSVEKNARGGGNINNVFSSYEVTGLQGNPKGIQKGLLQEILIDAINLQLMGFANDGTALQWNINLKEPESVIGKDYQSMAHGLEMGLDHHH